MLVAALIVGLLLAGLALRVFAGYPRRPGLTTLAPREAALVAAAAECVFPPGGAVRPSGAEAGVTAWVDGYVGTMPRATRILMRLLFLLVEQATLVFPAPGAEGWKRFSSLGPDPRRAALEGWGKSRFFPRRLVFTSLRAILTMGYFAHPAVLRELSLAPFAIDTPVREADLLYPPVGRGPEAIRFRPEDVDWTGETRPVGPEGPLHPDYAAEGAR